MIKKFDYSQNNNIDFVTTEKELGFEVHNDLKDFYQKNLFSDNIELNIDKKYLEKSVNKGNWFEESKNVYVILSGNEDLINFSSKFIRNFDQTTIYGSETHSDKRYLLGFLYDERGAMNLFFNNENGAVEWYDFEWGGNNWEENPRGIISNNIQEFIKLLKTDN